MIGFLKTFYAYPFTVNKCIAQKPHMGQAIQLKQPINMSNLSLYLYRKLLHRCETFTRGYQKVRRLSL